MAEEFLRALMKRTLARELRAVARSIRSHFPRMRRAADYRALRAGLRARRREVLGLIPYLRLMSSSEIPPVVL